MDIGSNIEWSNAQPDAVGDVKFKIYREELAFTNRIAYHDSNWSDEPFTTSVASWFWGHDRLEPYSFVWLDYLGLSDVEHVGAYTTKSGKIITANCVPASVKIRPTEANDEYSPSILTSFPSSFSIAMDLGSKGTLNASITTEQGSS